MESIPFYKEWIAGAISGGLGVMVGNPLDVIKVRLQAGATIRHHTGKPPKLWTQILELVRNEGISSLIRGAVSPVVSVAGLNSLLFVSYSHALNMLKPPTTDFPPSLYHVSVAGLCSGSACYFITTPTELIKCRIQIQNSRTGQCRNNSYISELLSIYRNGGGIAGFYRGGLITLIRDGPGYAVYFGCYEAFKRKLERAFTLANHGDQLAQFWAGGFAGVISWASIYPVDVIKSRIQVSHAPTTPGMVEISRVTRHMYENEGIGSFVRGIKATLIRAFFVNAVTFLTYEQLISAMND